jgi:hypothetical protein
MPELFDIMTFDSTVVENVDITTTDPDWTDLVTLTTPARTAGTYGAVLSLQFTLNSTSQSFIYRVSTDGGATWGPDYQKEVKDRSNIEVIELLDLIDHTAAGPIDIRCQVTRESTATCSVIKALLTCERKG